MDGHDDNNINNIINIITNDIGNIDNMNRRTSAGDIPFGRAMRLKHEAGMRRE